MTFESGAGHRAEVQRTEVRGARIAWTETGRGPAAIAEPMPHIYSGLVKTPPAPEVAESLLPSALRGAALSDLPDNATLAALRPPVLILAWSGDTGHSLSTARHLTGVIPGAESVIADTPMHLRQWPQIAAEFLR